MGRKQRLDAVLVEQGYFDTVDEAKRAVMAGIVFSNEERLDKPGEQVTRHIKITIKDRKTHQYVSRGGLKLAKALQKFGLKLDDKVVLDVGASTGGFTDCALQHGAKLCYAVDVGYNQLAWELRQDARVVVMERTNFRYLTKANFKKSTPNFATIDVSFISLKLILPILKTIIATDSDVIALIKPQFEAKRDEVGRKGIVRDKETHEKVITDLISFSLEEGFTVENLTYSPITGSSGNIEFLLHLRTPANDEKVQNKIQNNVAQLVLDAHENLLQ